MEVFKTLLFFEGYDEGNEYLIETIEIAGQWWLVRSWLAGESTGARTPEKLVRLTGLAFQEVNELRCRFVLNNALPKSVYDGEAREGFVVAVYQALSQSPEPSDKTRH